MISVHYIPFSKQKHRQKNEGMPDALEMTEPFPIAAFIESTGVGHVGTE